MGRDFWESARVIDQALDAIDHTGDSRMPDTQKIAVMTRARALADRMAALAAVYRPGRPLLRLRAHDWYAVVGLSGSH